MKRNELEDRLVKVIRETPTIVRISPAAARYLGRASARRVFERYPDENQDKEHEDAIADARVGIRQLEFLFTTQSRRGVGLVRPSLITEERAREVIASKKICGFWPIC